MKGLGKDCNFDAWELNAVATKNLPFLISSETHNVHVDIGGSSHLPNMDKRGHLVEHPPTPSWPHGY